MKIKELDTTRLDRLIPIEIRQRQCIVAGCGTTGSWAARTLLQCGFPNVTIFDGDAVEPHNRPAQFHKSAAGRTRLPKVIAFTQAQIAMGMPVPLHSIPSHFTALHELNVKRGAWLFSCVDSVKARATIAATAIRREADLLIDFRMSEEYGAILFAGERGASWDDYLATLKRPFEEENRCGKQALLTTAMSIVGIGLGHLFAATAGRQPLKPRIDVMVAPGFAEPCKEA